MITVVGMGRKSGDLTEDGRTAILRADIVVVKSAKTHVAKTVAAIRNDAVYCDDLFETAADFDSLNRAIAQRLYSYGDKRVTFCVVGEGSDDTTVQSMHGVSVVPGVSLYSSVVGNSIDGGSVVYTAQDFISAAHVLPQPTVIKCIYDKYVAAEVQLKLLRAFDPDTEVVYCYDKSIVKFPLSELIKQRFGYQSTLYIKPKALVTRQVFDYYDCTDIMTLLCSPDGCPWDREQTHKSIIKNVIEEAYELADALEKEDTNHTVEELGDLLMQVIFHLEIAGNNGEFEPETVYTGLCRKLIDRHPHVFGDVKAADSGESLGVWERQKLKEHRIKGTAQNVLDVPRGMSALMRCQKVSSRASKGGYEFESVEQVAGKVIEELKEFLAADSENRQMEGGDLLFACASLLRLSGIDAETALLMSTEKFITRVVECERLLSERSQNLKEMSAAEFDALWQEAKRNVG